AGLLASAAAAMTAEKFTLALKLTVDSAVLRPPPAGRPGVPPSRIVLSGMPARLTVVRPVMLPANPTTSPSAAVVMLALAIPFIVTPPANGGGGPQALTGIVVEIILPAPALSASVLPLF